MSLPRRCSCPDTPTTEHACTCGVYAPAMAVAVARVRHQLDTAQRAQDVLADEVMRARAAGASWTLIGHALQMTRQSAHNKYRADDAYRLSVANNRADHPNG